MVSTLLTCLPNCRSHPSESTRFDEFVGDMREKESVVRGSEGRSDFRMLHSTEDVWAAGTMNEEYNFKNAFMTCFKTSVVCLR